MITKLVDILHKMFYTKKTNKGDSMQNLNNEFHVMIDKGGWNFKNVATFDNEDKAQHFINNNYPGKAWESYVYIKKSSK